MNYNFITSTENQNVIFANSLQHKKFRDKHNCYLIEGKRLVKDALLSGAEITMLFLTEKNADLIEEMQIKENIICENIEIFLASDRIIKKICNTLQPQGIAAIVKIKREKPNKIINDCLVLESISDPGNLGSIIRTAAASGYKDIFILSGVDAYNPKCIRSTMGGINFVNIYDSFTLEETINLLKASDIFMICADMDGDSLFTFCRDGNKILDSEQKLAIIIGSEADGVSNKLKNSCDKVLSLPMANVESLNAAVCASVMMYHFKFNEKEF